MDQHLIMNSPEPLRLGKEGCAFKDIVDVFFNKSNASTVCKNWTNFARELGFEVRQIDKWRRAIYDEKIKEEDALHQMLELWKSEKRNEATLPELIKHLEKIDFNNVANDLRKMLPTENGVQKFGASFNLKIPDHYIPRTLIARRVIGEEVFSTTKKDIFVFRDIARWKLSPLIRKNCTETSTNQVHKNTLSVRFILLEYDRDWDESESSLCHKTTDPIHLLRHEDGRFHWISTKGDISALQQALDEKNPIELSESEFIKEIENERRFQTNQAICISDSPGMGKSSLLASIGRQLQDKDPQRCIAFIVISEFVVKIRELLLKFDNREKAVLEALSQILCENNPTRKQLVQKIKTPTGKPSTQVELMFDGFDEVSTENLDLANKCLDTLIRDFAKSIRVWVTTRPQHLHQLEKRFSVLGYKIKAFQEEHQINFLSSFWNSQDENLDADKLQTFSTNFLRTLKEKLNKENEDIAGIPLQCWMIAEVYKPDALRFCDSKNEHPENWSASANWFNVNLIADLYEKLIDYKINQFIRTYRLQEADICNIWDLHMYFGFELIFPSHAHKFMNILPQIESGFKEDYVNVGIIDRKASPKHFIHRTFAQYLAARFFVFYVIPQSTDDLKNASKKLPNFLFKHVLESSVKESQSRTGSTYYQHSFKYSVVCHFFDALLRSKKDNSTEHCISQKSTNYLRDIMYASIHSDFGNILEFIRILKSPDNFCINLSDSEILTNATTNASSDLLKILLERFVDEPLTAIKGKFPNPPTVLHAAVRRGNYDIFEYILKLDDFEDLVKKDERFLNLVYWAVENTLSNRDEIKDRIEIIRFLKFYNVEMIEFCDPRKRTPLFASSVNILLLKELIDCGANLFHTDDSGNTILHKATEYLSPTDYCSLLEFIPKDALTSLLKLRNKNEELSLHHIVKHGLATQTILNQIRSSGVDMKAKGKIGHTCIFYALQMENEDETIPTIKLLLDNGVDHTIVCFNGDSILHYSAEMGRVDCLGFFLKEKKMNINQINDFGNTPIFNALHNHNSALITVRFLLKKGADYRILNSKGNNLLHYSASCSQIECLQLFLRLGRLDINQTDDDEHHFQVRNFVGLPPLHVNATNCDNDTPLHLVFRNIKNYHYDLSSFLENILSLGVDVNAKNNEGETPLDIYKRVFSKWQEEIKQKGVEISERLDRCVKKNNQ